MSQLSAFAFFVSPRVIPIELIALGSTMLLLITLLHGAGLDRIVARYRKAAEKAKEKRLHPRLAVFIFALAILFMLLLHIVEIWIWGMALNKSGLVLNLRDAIYFSANTYTTVGYGDMVLPADWRELSSIIAISGLFTFAWTTSEMFNIVSYQHNLVLELTNRRHRKANA